MFDFDPLDSFAKLMGDLAKRVEEWQLHDPSDERRGRLRTAALHVRLAIKHLYRAEGRWAPGESRKTEPPFEAILQFGAPCPICAAEKGRPCINPQGGHLFYRPEGSTAPAEPAVHIGRLRSYGAKDVS